MKQNQKIFGDFQYCKSSLCKNTYLSSLEAMECSNRDNNFGVTCSVCSPGKFISSNSSKYECSECLPGQYSNYSGANKCLQCPLGNSNVTLAKLVVIFVPVVRTVLLVGLLASRFRRDIMGQVVIRDVLVATALRNVLHLLLFSEY